MVIITTTVTHTETFGHGNLDLRDIVAIPDRLKDPITKTKDHNVLYGFFAQVVVDAIDLIFMKALQEMFIQRLRTLQIVAKGLFDNQPRPAITMRLGKIDFSQQIGHRLKNFRRRGQINQ